MLEPEEAALARGRVPWLEISGFGAAQDAHRIQRFDPRGEGAAEAMEQALADADIAQQDLACIVASAAGSPAGDEIEARALDRVFGERLPAIPICAPKAAFGEAAGASGALSALVAGLALQQQYLPPTVGFDGHSNGLRLAAQSQTISGDYALVNAFGCDGNSASLVIRLWKN
jgi:3-oxoacyl-[acyl-carrier-protein] synthase II